jgi:copper(I)-binding protein
MIRNFARGLAALVAAGVLAPAVAGARDYVVGDLRIGHPWIRATPNVAPTAAAYLTVTNRGHAPDRLLGGVSPDAASVEPHSMSMAGGVMRMRRLAEGFPIAPGATLSLAPGGGHLMLIAPRRPFRVGDKVPVTLKFAGAGAVKVEFAVEAGLPAAAMAMPAR